MAAQEAADTGETEEEETITAYLRVGDSQIVYQITSEDYQELMAASYNDLRHQEVLSADFGDIWQIEVTLEGASHTLTTQGEGEDRTWLYQGEEVDISAFQEALESLSADSFTDERPSQRQEIALTVYLDNDAFPQVAVELYRWGPASTAWRWWTGSRSPWWPVPGPWTSSRRSRPSCELKPRPRTDRAPWGKRH